MLKVINVSYDICKYGPAIAHPTITIEFEPVDEYQGNLFEDLKATIDKKGLIEAYNEAINYKNEVFFLFKGRIFQKDNIPVYQELFNEISKEAAQVQKTLLDAHTITVNQMRPPYFMWEGIPQDFTGVENAYNDFNIPFVILEKGIDYSPIALQQIMNHPFGTVFVKWTGPEAIDLFKEIKETFHGMKCFLMADSFHYEDAKKFALENKCCLYQIQ